MEIGKSPSYHRRSQRNKYSILSVRTENPNKSLTLFLYLVCRSPRNGVDLSGTEGRYGIFSTFVGDRLLRYRTLTPSPVATSFVNTGQNTSYHVSPGLNTLQ